MKNLSYILCIFTITFSGSFTKILANATLSLIFAPRSYGVMEPLFFAQRSYGAFVLCPTELWSLHFVHQGVMDPVFFAQRSNGAFVLRPAELWSNATCMPQTHEDTVSGPKRSTQNIKSLIICFKAFFLSQSIVMSKI